jgi:hypothetical protein
VFPANTVRSAFTQNCVGLLAENRQAVENDRETIIALKMMRTNQN